jgi:hypothetical protein
VNQLLSWFASLKSFLLEQQSFDAASLTAFQTLVDAEVV